MALLDRLGTAGAMRFPEELTLFRKAMLTLSGVVHDVAGSSPIDAVLIQTGLQQYCRELPARQFAPFDSRAFGTHLSNADVVDFVAGLPMAQLRYWLETWRDALDAKHTALFGRAPISRARDSVGHPRNPRRFRKTNSPSPGQTVRGDVLESRREAPDPWEAPDPTADP